MKKKLNKIPKFKNYNQEAKFWDTHDTADFESEFKPVNVYFAKNLSKGITIRFDSKTLSTIRIQAQNQGIGPTTLIRMWVLEKLQQRPAFK